MRRYASIDFLRGIMIFSMVLLHTPMRWYDRSWMKEDGAEASGLAVFFFAILIFFGAWAGLFLLVSSVSNMISMQRNLERGKSVLTVVKFQVFGGILLLAAAFLVESTIGYHGYMGKIVELRFDRWDMVLWRGFHMETIHTIAYCMIINGIVQGVLSRNSGHLRYKRNMRIYAFLILVCLALTIPAYQLARSVYSGYPSAEWESSLAGRMIDVQYPVIGESGIGEVVVKFILMPLAGNPEPILPFLAVSFIGSMIGLFLCRKRLEIRSIGKGYLIGAGMVIIGLAGISLIFLSGLEGPGVLMDNSYQLPELYPNLWIWWFLANTGGQILLLLLMIRLVEFRGMASSLARRTVFIRRFGFVAFSVYTFQFLDVVPRSIFQIFPFYNENFPYPDRLPGISVMILTIMVIAGWSLLLVAWEKIGYFGGMEWMIAKFAERMMPDKREGKKTIPWWKVRRLDPDDYFYNVEWIDIIPASGKNRKEETDSRLAFWLSIIGLLIFPLSLVAFLIGKGSIQREGKNQYNRLAMIFGAIGMVIFTAILISLSLINGIPI